MKRLLGRAHTLSGKLGVDPIAALRRMSSLASNLRWYFRDLKILKSQMELSAKDFPLGALFPCLYDKFADAGSASGHYFHQDLLVAKRVYLNNPAHHVDVGSRIDGFVAHVAVFRSITVIDIRNITSGPQNINFLQADIMAPLRANIVECCDSLSCLHALEHFGLGRYGDPITYDGHLVGLENLYKILKRGGKLYLSVPIGPQRVEFNAHRVFSVSYLLRYFTQQYRLDQFSYIDDLGDLHENVPVAEESAAHNYGCNYGCGIFELTKL